MRMHGPYVETDRCCCRRTADQPQSLLRRCKGENWDFIQPLWCSSSLFQSVLPKVIRRVNRIKCTEGRTSEPTQIAPRPPVSYRFPPVCPIREIEDNGNMFLEVSLQKIVWNPSPKRHCTRFTCCPWTRTTNAATTTAEMCPPIGQTREALLDFQWMRIRCNNMTFARRWVGDWALPVFS